MCTAAKFVSLPAGQTTDIVVNFEPDTTPGLLTVTLSPPDAVTAGAKWRVNGGAPQGSGATLSLPAGNNYSITFDPVGDPRQLAVRNRLRDLRGHLPALSGSRLCRYRRRMGPSPQQLSGGDAGPRLGLCRPSDLRGRSTGVDPAPRYRIASAQSAYRRRRIRRPGTGRKPRPGRFLHPDPRRGDVLGCHDGCVDGYCSRSV